MKKRQHLDFTGYKKRALKNPRVKKEYDRLQPEFALIEAVLEARKQKGLTQKELAKKMGTKQSAISRLEAGRANPTVGFLKKLASAMNARLEINILKS